MDLVIGDTVILLEDATFPSVTIPKNTELKVRGFAELNKSIQVEFEDRVYSLRLAKVKRKCDG